MFQSGVITIHAVLITNVDDRGIIQTVKMNNNPNVSIQNFPSLYMKKYKNSIGRQKITFLLGSNH